MFEVARVTYGPLRSPGQRGHAASWGRKVWALGIGGFGILVGLVSACRSESDETPPELPGSDAAPVRVGNEIVEIEWIKSVSASQAIPLGTAARGVARDVLFAQELLRREPLTARYLRSVALARTMSEELREQVKAEGPLRDEEIAEVEARHWWDIERPESFRTTHAVVLADANADRGAARSVAESIRQAVSESGTAERFRERAREVLAGGFEIKIEDLDPVAADGRVIPKAAPQPGQPISRLVESFARAAAALTDEGQVSPVTETDFGFHVLILTERVPAKQMPSEARQRLLEREVYERRARAALEATLSRARAEWSVSVDRAALSLTEGLRIDP